MQRWIEVGPYPWWTLPELKLALWRPLSSALMVLDHSLFGKNPVPYHAHSILWHLLAIVGAAGVLRLLPSAVGGIAICPLTIRTWSCSCSRTARSSGCGRLPWARR